MNNGTKHIMLFLREELAESSLGYMVQGPHFLPVPKDARRAAHSIRLPTCKMWSTKYNI